MGYNDMRYYGWCLISMGAYLLTEYVRFYHEQLMDPHSRERVK